MNASMLLLIAGALLLFAGRRLRNVAKRFPRMAETLRLCARLLALLGCAVALSSLAPENGGIVILAPLFVIAAGLVAHAYIRYREAIQGNYLVHV